MTTIAVIPARYGSTRFPGKPLHPILGKPMIQWVCERAARVRGLDRVLVATDDPRIREAVRGFGGESVMTSPDCASGSDRVWQAIRDVACDRVVNLQGDEPALQPLSSWSIDPEPMLLRPYAGTGLWDGVGYRSTWVGDRYFRGATANLVET